MPSLATNLDDLKSRITTAVNSLENNTLRSVRNEFNYRLDVVCEARQRHIL